MSALTRRVARRLGSAAVTFLGVTGLAFLLLLKMPGPVGGGDLATSASLDARLRAEYRLDEPVWLRYGHFLGKLLRLDLGESLQDRRPVVDRLAEAFPRSALLALLAVAVALLLAVTSGLWAAGRKGHWLDRAMSVGAFGVNAMPAYWVALLLLMGFAAGGVVQWFPMQGFTSPEPLSTSTGLDVLWHLTLPVLALAIPLAAALFRFVREGARTVLAQDYIRAARLKGLSERRIFLRHVLPPTLLPLISLLGVWVPALLSGAVVVESVFGIRGVGLLLVESLSSRDVPMVLGLVTLAATVTLVSTVVADLLAAWADPRVREGFL
jgi:peptide/nickel transport system permease protein